MTILAAIFFTLTMGNEDLELFHESNASPEAVGVFQINVEDKALVSRTTDQNSVLIRRDSDPPLYPLNHLSPKNI